MPPEALSYRLDPYLPHAHRVRVTLAITEPDPAGQSLSMAAWIPGSYMIRDFAKHVVGLSARCGDEPVAVEKVDKQTWRCAPCAGALTVEYEVYCWDLSVRGAHFDATHGFFNGTSLFLKVHGREGDPCAVEILPPPGEAFSDWRIATTLPSAGAAAFGFGHYQAGDYDELVDHPIEMGRFTLLEFEVAGRPHAMAITGRQQADSARLATDLQKVCSYHVGLFGEFPTDRYLFLTMAVGDGYGGLEHRASTALICKRDDLPRPGLGEPDEGYRNFLGLCSHEYFHTWNVKRIKPAAFTPYDLSGEVHTRLLWAFEGITSYYDELALVRSGLISPESYLELLGQTITRVLRTPGRQRQSVTESSFDAWTKFYKQDENAPNAIVSYYAKGALIALALDLLIRRDTESRRSLDDVMRGLWAEYGKTGRGIAETELEAVIERFAEIPLGPFFQQALYSTDDLPLEELLNSVGVGLHLRATESDSDKGGKPVQDSTAGPDLGVRLDPNASETRIQFCFEGRPAMNAGLSAGDVIIAVEGLKADRGSLERLLKRHQPGDRVRLHAFRRDELLEIDVELGERPLDTCYLTLDEAEAEVLKRRQLWLTG